MPESRFVVRPTQPIATVCIFTLPIVWVCCTAFPVSAQMRPVVINNANVITGDGRTLNDVGVSFQNGAITGVGEKVEAGMMARKIDAKGRYVTPGLIDVWSTIGLRDNLAPGRPTARAQDAFDGFDDDELQAAWQQGITAIYVPARGNGGFAGTGAVFRLGDSAGEDRILAEGKMLHTAIDPRGNSGTIARVRTVNDLRKMLAEAKEYRQAKEDYDEELKEYEKKILERAKKEKEKEAADAGKGIPASQPKKEGAAAKPADAPKPAEPPKPDSQPAGKDKEKPDAKDEIKKPAEPGKDRSKDVLLKLLDGELTLRAEANRPEDILNLLELARDFNVAMVIDGGAAAHLLVDQLKSSGVPVVLQPDRSPLQFTSGPERFAAPDSAALLRRSGVSVYLGSGIGPPNELYSPNLALFAAEAVGAGFTSDEALKLLTSDAARFLGIDKKHGRLASGMAADLVIWSDHPLAPGARVERVFVAGNEVYRAGRSSTSKVEDDE